MRACVPACHAACVMCVCVCVRERVRVRVRVCVCAVCLRACATTTAPTTTPTAAKTATTTTTKIDATESRAGDRLPLSSTTRQGTSWGVTVLFTPKNKHVGTIAHNIPAQQQLESTTPT